MKRIYLVRHGESIANKKGIYQGQTYDTGLSLLGKKQVKKLAEKMKKLPLKRIFSSPLKRTKLTAEKVNNYHDLQILFDERLKETNHGEWEGKNKDEISKKWPGLYYLWLTNPSHVSFPRGESFKEVERRVIDWWGEIVQLEGDTLVVTHDNIIRIVLLYLGEKGNIWDYEIHSAGLTIIEREGKENKILTVNDTEHLNKYISDLNIHAL